MLSAENKYSVFKTQFLAYLTLIETEDLTKGYPLSVQPELPIKECVLSDAPSDEIRQSKSNLLYNEKWHTWNQAWVESEDPDKLPK